MKTIRLHDTGPAVEDVQKRFRMLGWELATDGVFGQRTQRAVQQFRAKQGLPQADVIDDETWHALVDATFSLGDRMLYLRMPYFHGRDVFELQNILEVLGFILGGPDGIFGASTEHALREFQASVGLSDDGIAGRSTYEAVTRLRHAWEGKSTVADDSWESTGFVRAAEVLRHMQACFYGLDEQGRAVASRIANLARATTSDAHVMSADELGGVPPQTMMMVGISTSEIVSGTVPQLRYAEDAHLSQRLRTTINALSSVPKRIIITIASDISHSNLSPVERERHDQHLAVVLLDAFCAAFG